MGDVLTGDDAFAALEQAANQQVEPAATPVLGVDEAEAVPELPIGYRFVSDLKQRHLHKYWELRQQYKPVVDSRFDNNQHIVESAIQAGWFAQPAPFVMDNVPESDRPKRLKEAQYMIGDSDFLEVETVAIAVLGRFREVVTVSKN